MSQRQQWEYKVVIHSYDEALGGWYAVLDGNAQPILLEPLLNRVAAQGWELVSIVLTATRDVIVEGSQGITHLPQNYYVTFKRPTQA